MLLEQTIDKLNVMKLFALAKSLQERLERQDHQNLSKAEFVGLLVDDEWLYRENRKLTGRLRVAKFKDRAASLEAVNTRPLAAYARIRSSSWRRTAGSPPINQRWSQVRPVPAKALSRKPSGSTRAAAASPPSICACR